MHRIAEIVGSSIGLEPLEDETFFSWCSRYHRLAANGLDRATCMQLFGHPRFGAAHDLPSRIDEFVKRSHGSLGDAEEIILNRTVLPFYLPFKSLEVSNQAIDALRGDGIGPLKYRLGLLTSGMGAAHPLKACPQCIQNDLTQHGWSYWRRSQQLPGVWICLKHHVALQVSYLKVEQVARFSWVLPSLAQCERIELLEEISGESTKHTWLHKLAEMSCELVSCKAAEFKDPGRIAQVFKLRLANLGLSHASGQVRWREMSPYLQDLAANLAHVPTCTQQAAEDLLRTQLVSLLSGRTLAHPLRYLVWIVEWFDDLEAFRISYRQTLAHDGDTDPELMCVPTADPQGSKLDHDRMIVLARVREGVLSLTAAARQLEVTYATVAAWAASEQMIPPRRPKKLDAGTWRQALMMLHRGDDKAVVAKACVVSQVTVTRILRNVPGLQDHWHQVRHDIRRNSARQAWQGLAALHVHLGVKALRRLEPAAYAWLYRNDREWLKAKLAQLGKLKPANHAALKMEYADRRMAIAVQRAALSLTKAASSISLEVLKRSVPALGKVVHFPERWPVTVKALRATLAARKTGTPLLKGLLDD